MLDDDEVGQNVTVIGLVMQVKKLLTKSRGEEMAFVKLEDESGGVEGVIFPRSFVNCKEVLVVGQPVIICGKIDKRNDEFTLIIDYAEHPAKCQSSGHGS